MPGVLYEYNKIQILQAGEWLHRIIVCRLTREITGKRTWLGMSIRKMTIRIGADDALYLTEDLTHNKESQGVAFRHDRCRLEAAIGKGQEVTLEGRRFQYTSLRSGVSRTR